MVDQAVVGRVLVFNCGSVNSILGAFSQLGGDKEAEPCPK